MKKTLITLIMSMFLTVGYAFSSIGYLDTEHQSVNNRSL